MNQTHDEPRGMDSENHSISSAGAAAWSYFAQVLLSAIAAPAIGFLLLMAIPDSVSNTVERILGEPVFLLPIGAACCFAILVVRQVPHRMRLGRWVWVLPLIWFLFEILEWYRFRYPGQLFWPDIWNNFFGTQCGGSECLYEWTVTSPLYCAASYSIAVALASTTRRAHPSRPQTVAGQVAGAP
jgi:hypothetical protein